MELELKKVCRDAFDIGAEQILTQEETAETIVPDYCPDIARIIDTEGKVFLHSRDLHDGKAEVSGTVRVTVLYTSEGEGGIRTLEFAMPFSAETDAKAMPDCVILCASTETEFLEARILNSRKIFTRCKLVTKLTGYRKAPLCFCTDVEAEPEACIEKRQEPQHTTVLTHIIEKDFTFSDEMNLSPGKDGAAEILTNRVISTVTETKIVGNKLILKGVFNVCLLYRSAEGTCCSASGELPFSQIIEVEDAAENSNVVVQLQLTGTDIQVGNAADQEGRQVAVTLYLHAIALLREEQELMLLSDLYSTAYDLDYEASPLLLTEYSGLMTQRQMVREILEIGVVANSILSLHVQCSNVSVSRDGKDTQLHTGATVRALYLDEGDVPLVAERCIDVSCQMDLPEDCHVTARAACPEDVQGTLGDKGIEVRFPVEFQVQTSSRKKKVCISSAKIASDTPKDLSGAPSLVLRAMGKGENLWSLAKRYNTTISAILAANGMEDENSTPTEKLLLIPRKRT